MLLIYFVFFCVAFFVYLLIDCYLPSVLVVVDGEFGWLVVVVVLFI